MLLFLSQATGQLTALEIAKRMYVSPQAVDLVLKRFVSDGLVSVNDESLKSYVYSPKTEVLRETVKQCSRAYAEQRVNVIEMIFSSPMQNFADAFKFGREEG